MHAETEDYYLSGESLLQCNYTVKSFILKSESKSKTIHHLGMVTSFKSGNEVFLNLFVHDRKPNVMEFLYIQLPVGNEKFKGTPGPKRLKFSATVVNLSL